MNAGFKAKTSNLLRKAHFSFIFKCPVSVYDQKTENSDSHFYIRSCTKQISLKIYND